MSCRQTLLDLVNEMRSYKGQDPLDGLDSSTRLREDLAMDSFDLAELTVKIEEAFGVDVFADGLVATIGEVENRLQK